MKIENRSQVTLFLLLGILILSIVVILIVVTINSRQFTVDTDVNEKELIADTNSIDSCVDQIVNSFMLTSFQQGGVVYQDQNGGSYDADESEYIRFVDGAEEIRVRYGIINNPDIGIPPEYPYGNMPSLQLERVSNLGPKLWGVKNIPPLIASSMQPLGSRFCPILGCLGGTRYSIQGQMTDYVQSNLVQCLDTSGNSLAGTDYETDIEFSLDSITVNVRNVASLEGGDFTQRYNYRAARIYVIAAKILLEDVQDIRFTKPADIYDMRDCNFPEGALCLGEDDGIQISVIRDVPGSGGADILTVRDSRSLIKGEPLTLRTAIANRRPVIDFQTQFFPRSVPRFFVDAGDAYALPGEHLFFLPEIRDADEDKVNVTYEGWGQDTGTRYDMGSCCAPTGECVLYPSWIPNLPNSCYTDITPPNKFMESIVYDTGLEGICPGDQCFNISVGDNERGVHQFSVTANDFHATSGNNIDFATVRVVIGDSNDEVWPYEDYIGATIPFQDRCDFIYDMQILAELGPTPELRIGSGGCQATLENAPTLIPSPFSTGIVDLAPYLQTCQYNLSTDREYQHALRLWAHRNGGTPAPFGFEDVVTGCFWKTSADPFLFYTDPAFGPFGDIYDLNNFELTALPGDDFYSPSEPFVNRPPSELFCRGGTPPDVPVGYDFPATFPSGYWGRIASVPYSSQPGYEDYAENTLCRYTPGQAGCVCWECDPTRTNGGTGCTMYASMT